MSIPWLEKEAAEKHFCMCALLGRCVFVVAESYCVCLSLPSSEVSEDWEGEPSSEEKGVWQACFLSASFDLHLSIPQCYRLQKEAAKKQLCMCFVQLMCLLIACTIDPEHSLLIAQSYNVCLTSGPYCLHI